MGGFENRTGRERKSRPQGAAPVDSRNSKQAYKEGTGVDMGVGGIQGNISEALL